MEASIQQWREISVKRCQTEMGQGLAEGVEMWQRRSHRWRLLYDAPVDCQRILKQRWIACSAPVVLLVAGQWGRRLKTHGL